jgi:serine/threonine-protein kinase
MKDPFDPAAPGRSPIVNEALVRAFRDALRQGGTPPIESFLERGDERSRPELLYQLLLVEIDHRLSRGDRPDAIEYRRRFRTTPDIVERAFRCDARTVSMSPPPEAGEVAAISNYRDLRFHDQGGLGEVFFARDETLNRNVALKLIQSAHMSNAEQRERFRIEAEVTGRLDHPGVVPVYSRGQSEDGRPFYTMRFIQGKNLKNEIDSYHAGRQGRTNPAEQRAALKPLLRHLVSAANTIAYAHNRGVVHGDVKPDNIMLGKFGEALVVDWGLVQFVQRDEHAKASGERTLTPKDMDESEIRSNSGVGTIGYMSPEQLPGSSQSIGPRSDVYGLGATLYRTLTGQPAFRFREGRAALDLIREGEFQPPRTVVRNVPAPLEAICLKAMATRPDDRYATADEFGRDVQRWIDDVPVSVYPEPTFERWMRSARQNPSRTIAVVSAAVVLLLVTLVSTLVFNGTATNENRLRRQAQNSEQIAEQARLANLRSTALFAANAFGHEIDQRWRMLGERASDPRLAALVRRAAAPSATRQDRDALQDWLIKHSASSLEDRKAASWFVQDANGIQLARSPWKSTIGNSYRHRSYFHGEGRDVDVDEAHAYGPVERPTLSAVYESTKTRELKVAFSVPIWDPGQEVDVRPLGVLAMSVGLGEFVRLDNSIHPIRVVLADLRTDWLEGEPRRGLILDHPRLKETRRELSEATGQFLVRLESERIERLLALWESERRARSWGEATASANRTLAGSLDTSYVDPVAIEPATPCVAAFRQVYIKGREPEIADVGWVVIVQDHRGLTDDEPLAH